MTIATQSIGRRTLFGCLVKRAASWLLLMSVLISLIFWLFHTYHRAYELWQSASNLRELSATLSAYASQNSGKYPYRLGDLFLLDAGNGPGLDPNLFIVPWGSATPVSGRTPAERAAQFDAGGHCSFVYLGAGLEMNHSTSGLVILCEADGPYLADGVYCLFGDGHGEQVPVATAIRMIAETVKAASQHPINSPLIPPTSSHD